MQADDEKMFLENIEEFVMDESKIVTYKWLSATLDLHVNTAKQLLYKYAMPDNKRKDGVHMTYLVAGALADGSGMKIQIVRENDLDNIKSQFKLITSEHIYSVQKANHLPDLNILYGVDNLKNEKHNEDRFGAIRCSRAVRRLQIKARATTAVVNNPISSSKKGASVPTNSSSDKVRSEPITAALPVIGSKASKPEPTKPVESKASNGGSIASLFTAQTKASKNNDKAASGASNNKPAAKKAKGGGGIAMFFTKQGEKQAINTEHKETKQGSKESSKETKTDKIMHATETPISVNKKVPSSAEDKSDIKMDVDKEEKTTPKCDVMEEKRGKNSQKVVANGKQTNSSGKGKKKKSKEKSQPTKKRKRIMVISDDSASSGEDIFGNDSDTERRSPSPELLPEAPSKCQSSDEDMIPSTPISQQIRNGKVRKRKLVNKTFEDKDGFIMTKKEYVFESCSDDDADNDKQACTDHKIDPVVENPKTSKPNGEIKEERSTEEVDTEKPSKKQPKGEKQTKKKKASPSVGQKSKQSTLMSFFNKN